MTEPTVFLHFDQALDGQLVPDLDGAQPLIATAHMVQTLFDRQQTIPSEEFIMQLETTLFPTVVIPNEAEGPPVVPVIPSETEGSPAAAVSLPHPTPPPARIQPERTRVFHRWVAVAALLILLFGGAGAIILGPFQPHPTPEPSAIPAIGLGTVEASPEPTGEMWTVDPMPGAIGSDRPPIIANGVAFRTFLGSRTSPIQAVDIQTGHVLWAELPSVMADQITAVDNLLLVAGKSGNVAGFRYELIALDGRTGEQVWSEVLGNRPIGLLATNDAIFVLGGDNVLESFDLATHQRSWEIDLSRFVDSQGELEGLNRFSDLTGHRMAMTDETIGVLLSNGRMAAVDATNGELKWSDVRRASGWTRVKVVDGKFVVIAFGGETLMYDPEATPLPFTPSDPSADPCTLVIEPRSGSTPQVAEGVGETVDSFDPKTGKSPWGLVLPEQYLVWPVDGNRLVAQVEQIQSAGVADSSELISCLIDGSTGVVSETTGTQFATFTYGSSQTDEPWGIGVLPSGVPFWIEHLDSEKIKELPHFGFDPETFTGFRWVQKADGLILITEQNGTITGFPENAPAVVTLDATPALATPVADTSWIVPGPAGTHAESEATWPVVANGQIFRSFYTATADYHTQAVDMMTGAVLWDKPLDVRGEVMASSGDRLLVGGRENGMLKDFSLVALDQTSGNEIWRAVLPELPIAIAVDGDRGYVLGLNNLLDAVDLSAGTSIYTTDIGGNSKPVDSAIPIGSQHRMVIDGNVMVAVLADGSVAGVDAETGKGIWWNLRKGTGSVQVKSIADALIVTDFGDTSFYLPEESRNADGLATLVAVATPTVATCLDNLSAASPVATPAPRIAPNFRTTLTRIKPETGAVLWTVRDPGTFISVLTSDTDMIYLVSTAEEWPTDRSQTAICAIDLRTGRSSEIGSLSGMIDSTFLLTTPDYPDQVLVAGRLDSGEMTAFPSIFDPAVTGPKISIDLGKGEGTYWIGIYDNAIYLSRMDGQLEKIPIPAR